MLFDVKQKLNIQSFPVQRVFWISVFLYPIIVGLLLQLVLLPYIFPAWHAGDGVLVGGDGLSFHRTAVGLSEKIHGEGWQAWNLRPGGQIVSGIAAIFYTLITPKPWSVLPLNAVMHTIATWALFIMLRDITGDWRKAIPGAALFAFFPSSFTWTAQMHNDSFAIPGGLLFISGWATLARRASWDNKWSVPRSIVLILVGTWLLWLVRPYMITMMRGFAGICAIGLSLLFIWYFFKKDLVWWKTIAAIGTFLIISFASSELTTYTPSSGMRPATPAPSPNRWTYTSWIPKYIDVQFQSLSRTRRTSINAWGHAASNIDTNVQFFEAADLLLYLPRATQIAFLSPFPADWFGTGSKAPNTAMRRISGIEMIISYAAFLCLPYGMWRWRRHAEMWVLLYFCTAMLVVYALGVPNVGTLYRFRYAYFMSVVGLGISSGYAAYLHLKSKVQKGTLLESTPVR